MAPLAGCRHSCFFVKLRARPRRWSGSLGSFRLTVRDNGSVPYCHSLPARGRMVTPPHQSRAATMMERGRAEKLTGGNFTLQA
jgi:hypothetical protein